MAKAAGRDSDVCFEVWYNRDLGRGVGRHMKAASEADALKVAEGFAAEGHPNIEVLKVTTTREAIKR